MTGQQPVRQASVLTVRGNVVSLAGGSRTRGNLRAKMESEGWGERARAFRVDEQCLGAGRDKWGSRDEQ